MTTNDNRSRKFVFVPFCSLSQAFHASGLVKYEWSSVITPIFDILFKQNVNIIQLPCPESLFGGLKDSLDRKPQSYEQYNNDKFREHCRTLAHNVTNQISDLKSNNYSIACILGIQFSPSCAVDLQYTNKGNQKLPGIFIQELQALFNDNCYNIPFLGINRRGIKPTLKRLNKILSETKQQSLF